MVVEMYHKNFKHPPWVESIEVARPTICGFLRNRPWTNDPVKPPNTHPRPHLMAKEPTDLLNWSRRWTISGVQNVILY